MKFIVFCIVVALFYFHNDIARYLGGTDQSTEITKAAPQAKPASSPASQAVPTQVVIVGKDEDNVITKWFVDHTPKKK